MRPGVPPTPAVPEDVSPALPPAPEIGGSRVRGELLHAAAQSALAKNKSTTARVISGRSVLCASGFSKSLSDDASGSVGRHVRVAPFTQPHQCALDIGQAPLDHLTC